MKNKAFSLKKVLTGSLTAAALVLPLTLLAGSAQASRGSHTVTGEPNERTMEITGEQPRVVYPNSHAIAQPDTQNLSLAERAINPVFNPDKPINSGNHH
jgi:hypothetical protein